MIDLSKYSADLSAVLKRICEVQQIQLDETFYSPAAVHENLEVQEERKGVVNSAFLKEEYEYEFFKKIHHYTFSDSIYHYTSLESFFHIIDSGKIHLNSLTGLNDRSEVNYVNDFMMGKLDNPNNYTTIAYHNYHFIFCFSKLKDDLNQWRLYGDNTKGVMLEFEPIAIAHKNILWSNVNYELKIFKIIKEWLEQSRTEYGISFFFDMINYWKFFYKNPAYSPEKEVRLLIKNTNYDSHMMFEEFFKLSKRGIISPSIKIDCINTNSRVLKLKSITIGPNFPEPALNKLQIECMFVRKYGLYDFDVKTSKIDYYR